MGEIKLIIDNIKYKVLSSEIKFVNATNNKAKGYSVLVSLDIELNKVKGYVSFYVDFFKNKDYKTIENKIYNELPTNMDSKITMIEIFDTKKYIDFIDSIVKLKFGNIKNNQIEMDLNIDDTTVKLNYHGNLNIFY